MYSNLFVIITGTSGFINLASRKRKEVSAGAGN